MIYRDSILIIFTLLALLLISCSNESSDTPENRVEQFELPAQGLEVVDTWARPGRMDGTSAIYMNILNGSTEADTLLSVSSPVAGRVEVHETYEQEEGMMGMRPAKTVIAPARGVVSFNPGGLHVMMMRLNRELREGDSVEFTVEFAKSGKKTLTVPVQMMN